MSSLLVISVVLAFSDSVGEEGYDYQTDVRPILAARCVQCHGAKTQKGKLRLDTLATDFVKNRAAAESWHEALNAVRRGEMPPEDEKQLSAQERKILTTWIEGKLRLAIAQGTTISKSVVMRRLNRAEYQYTMTDLIGLDMDYASELPADALSADGFRNNGAALGMSALQLEHYLKSARRAMRFVLVDGELPERVVKKLELKTGRVKGKRYVGEASERLGRVNFWHGTLKDLPRTGPFTIRIKARTERAPGQPAPILLARYGYFVSGLTINLMDDVAQIDIPSTESTIYEITSRPEFFPVPEEHVPRANLNGIITLQNVLRDGNPIPKPIEVVTEQIKGKKKRKKKTKQYPEDATFPKIIIESVEFISHDYRSWPPALHRRIVPAGEDLASEKSVVHVLRGFLRRAWRRPPTPEELKKWGAHYEAIRPQCDTNIAALRETLSAALASTNFLYLSEPQAKSDERPRLLTAHEVASRLSYFLWSSLPDDQLAALADSGSLLNPAELRKQFARMLADQKSDRFATQFSTQWLDLDAVDRVAINPQYYDNFDNALKQDMVEETREFFKEILRSNSSALQFIDADFTMVNSALAKHYGLTGPRSQRFERVSLSGSRRPGGLLGHASTLLSGSDGADSHPIKRAVWIRERLLHDPPKPPPPDVPDLKASVPNFATLSIREQLAVHREKAACADCHRNIDPWGIALERYDAVGLWREKTARGKKAVSPDTILPGNHKMTGVADLQKHLLSERREQFTHALVSKLLTYALGRSLKLDDKNLIDELSQKFAENDYRLPALMEGIVTSEAFLSR